MRCRISWGIFREGGEVGLLDNLIHMCLMICTGNAAQTKLQRWAPEISLLLGRGISAMCLPWWGEMWSRVRARTQAFQWLEVFWWKQNRSSCRSPGWVWVCMLSEPVLELGMREFNLFDLCLWSFMKKLCGWLSVQVEDYFLLLRESTLAQSSEVQQTTSCTTWLLG